MLARLKRLVSLFSIAVLSLGAAEVAAYGQAVCNSAAVPATVRAQGLTEEVGTILLGGCSGALPASGVLSVFISPSTAAITNNPGANPTAIVSTIAGGVTTASAPIAATVSGNMATFAIPATPAGASLASIQIGSVPGVAGTVGIRVNAFATGLTSPAQILANFATGAGTQLSITTLSPAGLIVAIPEPGLFAFTTPGAAIFQGNPPALMSVPQTAVFTAGAVPTFAAFDTIANQLINPSSIPIIGITEGFGSALLPAGVGGEGADGSGIGTRMVIALPGLSPNIAVYAPQALATSTPAGTLVLKLVPGADANGSGGAILAGASGAAASLIAGSTITYEVTADNPSIIETVAIPLGLYTTGAVAAGTFSANVTLAPISAVGTPSSGAPIPRFANVPASPITAPGPPTITLSTLSTSFNVSVGATISPQSVVVTNSGGSILNWTAAVTSITGGSWLAVSPASGTDGTTATLSVNTANLAVGTYSATVAFSAPGATNSPQNLAVTLNITPTPLQIAPATLSFSAPIGGNPPPQQITILSGGGNVNWTASVSSAGGNWLSLSSIMGTIPASVNVIVNAAGLSPGSYQGAISVSAPGASNSPTATVSLVVGTPALSLSPTALSFSAHAGSNPPPQSFTVQNSGAGVLGWTANTSTQSGGNWLAVGPASGVAPSSLTVTINSSGLAAGVYLGSVTVTALQGSGTANSPQSLPVILAIDAPFIMPGGILNGASYSSDGVVSPNSIGSIFGLNLASSVALAGSASLPTTLASTQVLINQVAVPLYYVSPTQINFEVPPGLAGPTAQIAVVSNGVSSAVAVMNVAASAPGIFTANSGGSGQADVLNQDSSPNSAQNPAAVGSVLQIFVTGLGATNPPAVTGQPASTTALSNTVVLPTVLINGFQADVPFAGLAPGFVGLYQINARIPAGTPSGSAISLQVQQSGHSSNTATIAVR